jgi:hypothetical protein
VTVAVDTRPKVGRPKTPKVGRPKTPRDIADQQALARIASLAYQILQCLRQPDHAMYESERTLRQWLSDSGAQFTTADISPALGLLQSTGLIGRGPENKNSPRSGWLIGAAQEPVWSSGADVAPEGPTPRAGKGS